MTNEKIKLFLVDDDAVFLKALEIKICLLPSHKAVLSLSVFIVLMLLISGKSNIVYGVVLLVNFLAYILLIIHP
jgi:Ca2+:H+ antiporter